MRDKHVVIIGGSISGLAACLALGERGCRITVLEAEATRLPESPDAAFDEWQRRGSPQARQSHALLARLHNLLRDRAPDLLAKLLAAGAQELKLSDRLQQLFADAEPVSGDEDVVFLACRRIVFEYVVRRHVVDSGKVDFRTGVRVCGLLGHADAATGLPRVTGVRLQTAKGKTEELPAELSAPTELSADWVIDASGRRSQFRAWVEELGASPIREERAPCGIFYTSRFYRLCDGAVPPEVDGGLSGVDLGYVKLGIFAGDSRCFSITVAASPEDAAMRCVLKTRGFETVVGAVPRTAAWVAEGMARPISEVEGMAKLENVRRFPWQRGEPLFLGLFVIGDALIHSNPLTGRGCALGFVGAYGLAEALSEYGHDAYAAAKAAGAIVRREIVPWYELQLAQDRDATAVADAQRRGEDPFKVTRDDGTVDPKAYRRDLIRHGLREAVFESPELFRAFMRTLNLLDPPGNLMSNPNIMQAVLAAYAKRHERVPPDQGPTRKEMLVLLAEAGA